ncbi:tyrosine-type recombinase/integrase [Candidatus Moduliflexota bacterium]
MSQRKKTPYPGVFYRSAKRIGRKGTERVFYIVFKKNGKTIEEKVGRQYSDDMTPAKAVSIRADRIEGKRLSAKEQRAAVEAKRQAEACRWTISRLWGEYKAHRPDLKGIKADESRFALYLAPLFGDKEPSEIYPLDVDRLRLKLLKGKSPGTTKNVLELLRRIINFGVRKHLCVAPKFSIEMPRVDNLKTEDLTKAELQRLLESIEREINHGGSIIAANMMRLALYTGLRRGEMFKLKWEDVDFHRGFITLKNPKGSQDQKVPLNDGARKVLSSHPQIDGSDFVFPGRDGGQRTDIKKAVNRIKERAGLSKNFRALHGLRHVYASMLASSGHVDMYTLQKLLTHKSAAMTQRYAHLRDESLQKAASVAGGIIDKARSGKQRTNTAKRRMSR